MPVLPPAKCTALPADPANHSHTRSPKSDLPRLRRQSDWVSSGSIARNLRDCGSIFEDPASLAALQPSAYTLAAKTSSQGTTLARNRVVTSAILTSIINDKLFD
jgi:hypothetical protein